MTQALTNPNVISLAAGLVDYPSLPVEEASQLAGRILESQAVGQTALQYGTTEGLAPLRRALLDHLAALDGVDTSHFGATADDIIVSSGSQQLLYILTDVLIDPGDIVITAWPSYFVYTAALEAAGAATRCVEMDDEGMIPARLEELLSSIEAAGDLGRVKIVYLTSYHQNPTGITLSADRRPAILDIVRKYSRRHRILLVEDAAYRELTYMGSPPPSIKRYDEGNRHVALLQTFSKPFAPGFKTGYGLLPSDIVEHVVNQKGSHDFGSANFCQHLLLGAIDSGLYRSHVGRLCEHYRGKLAVMLAELAGHFGGLPHVRWTTPTGGLYVWLTLPPNVQTGPGGQLFRDAVHEGVLYVPGEYCYGPDCCRTVPHNTMRLTFGMVGIEAIPEAVARLARAVKRNIGWQ